MGRTEGVIRQLARQAVDADRDGAQLDARGRTAAPAANVTRAT